MKYKFFRILSFFGISLLKTKNLKQLIEIEKNIKDLIQFSGKNKGLNIKNTKSQINQDIFVLYTLNWKRNGFFVEFGATNGVDLSNTYLLEKDFGWRGILSEPNPHWRDEIIRNRKTYIDFNCVWRETGKNLDFQLSNEPEYSSLKLDNNKKIKKNNSIKVNTITLNDLLKKYNAPKNIDYLSIDTEGSEFEILKSFDFSKYNISIITCEHNYSLDRKNIFNLLVRNGYERVYSGLSRWDDWYVKKSFKE